jgi:crotonobetainyl-CoA:carnitine CoA-transferase CaiB-like acyl-CoA transferase
MTDFFKQFNVIDLSTVLAGPSVATFFAELGANVIKVENTKIADVTRSWKLPSEDPNSAVSAYFSSVNYQKKYIALDLKSDHDRSQFLHLIEDADILISNFKKGDEEKLGVSESILREKNPKLIWGKISGYGTDSDRVAYDLILQAETGYMSMNGEENGLPVKMPVAMIDVLAAHQLKEAILIALLSREKNGKGSTVNVSLYDAAISSLINQASNYLMAGHVPKRIGSMHPNIAPYGELFQTKDGKWVTFAIGSDNHFQKLCAFLGLDELVSNIQFATNHNRVKNRAVLAEKIQEKINQKNTTSILNEMHRLHVPAAVIKNLEEVFEEEQALAMVKSEKINGIDTKRVSSIAFKWITK